MKRGNITGKPHPPKDIPKLSDDDTRRFWSKVALQDGGCWDWLGTKTASGYAVFWCSGLGHRASRVVYRETFGDFDINLLVCHTCDNRGCVNPMHLFLGTHKINADDRDAKGRNKDNSTHLTKYYAEDSTRRPRGDSHPFRKNPELCARGEAAGPSKLTEKHVTEIRRGYFTEKIPVARLSKLFSISTGAIYKIINNQTWSHIQMKTTAIMLSIFCCSCSVNPIVVTKTDGSTVASLGGSFFSRSKAEFGEITKPDGTKIAYGKTGKNETSGVTTSIASWAMGQAAQAVSDNATSVLKTKELTTQQAQAGAEATKQAKIQADLARDTFVPPAP